MTALPPSVVISYSNGTKEVERKEPEGKTRRGDRRRRGWGSRCGGLVLHCGRMERVGEPDMRVEEPDIRCGVSLPAPPCCVCVFL